jgi:hypothetical protein
VVRNLRYRLYRWHLLLHLSQAGAQLVSQPSTPIAEPPSMMLAMYDSVQNDVQYKYVYFNRLLLLANKR